MSYMCHSYRYDSLLYLRENLFGKCSGKKKSQIGEKTGFSFSLSLSLNIVTELNFYCESICLLDLFFYIGK